MTMTATHTPWGLARLAACMAPDTADSPGALFLERVADDYREAVQDGFYDPDDGPHEIADAAVPIYTHDRWRTFVELGAYQEDASELGATADDLTGAAGVALYMIAERLVRALHDESDDDA